MQGDRQAVVVFIALVHDVLHVVGGHCKEMVAERGRPCEADLSRRAGRQRGRQSLDRLVLAIDVEADGEVIQHARRAAVEDRGRQGDELVLARIGRADGDVGDAKVRTVLVHRHLHHVLAHGALTVLDDHVDAVGARVVVAVRALSAVGPEAVAEVPEIAHEVAVAVDRPRAVEGQRAADHAGKIGPGVGERRIVHHQRQRQVVQWRVAPQVHPQRVRAGRAGRPVGHHAAVHERPQARYLGRGNEHFIAGRIGVVEVQRAAFGSHAVIGDDGLDGGLLSLRRRHGDVEHWLQELVRRQQRIAHWHVNLDRHAAGPGRLRAFLVVDDAELNGRGMYIRQ